ncbi:hypothetical protein E1B28_010268 [Marasmius oreades]|uniref:DUF1479-domain-containing protein n=1 Tax=Marasmius oreades TaxID=181124 RepID=A0A9P7UQY9_9AGAR|nr:uncharacterized protein E1B28_010268 [Marasmius oreades]KAG7091217.1 hypothetical protein E1B28_010268 [Marasmius oreades]
MLNIARGRGSLCYLRTGRLLQQRFATMESINMAQKKEGDISSVFSSLGRTEEVFPERFAQLKKDLWNDKLAQSWTEIVTELEVKAEEIASQGSESIPRVSYKDLRKGLTKEQVTRIKEAGIVIVTGAVPKEEALSWKKSIQEYAQANKPLVRGFPANNVQVFEFYNTVAQTEARTHPAVLDTQRCLLSLWHSSSPSAEVNLDIPISYFDRLRIRQPGDKMFTLGPHVDAGSIERWEDTTYRLTFRKILQGKWRKHDPYDVWPRLNAKQDLYHAPSQCSIFRPWQGWLSLSSTGPTQGTLQFFPALKLSTAYMILRPFFKPTPGGVWEVNLDQTNFPGSGLGTAQEFNTKTHPHMKLDKTVVSLPKVEPGDLVYWHCDGVHAVEAENTGAGDSSVMYIPAAPLTTYNAHYLRNQRNNFISGIPPPDFPGGEGESKFVGRGTVNDIKTKLGRQAYGLEPFAVTSPFMEKANTILMAA